MAGYFQIKQNCLEKKCVCTVHTYNMRYEIEIEWEKNCFFFGMCIFDNESFVTTTPREKCHYVSVEEKQSSVLMH